MSKDLVDLVQNLGNPRVLVVGDAMMDRYVWGDAERISQEAPVILLRAERKEECLGGASSVATISESSEASTIPRRSTCTAAGMPVPSSAISTMARR